MNLLKLAASARMPFLVVSLFITARAHADIERARSAFAEWARIKSLATTERSEWTREKALLDDTLKAAQAEAAALEQRITEIAGSSSESDKKRAKLKADIDEATATAAELATTLTAAEAGIRDVLPMLPGPLKSELQPLISRLPSGDTPTRLPVSQRLQTVAALLAQIEKFSSTLSLFSEVRAVGGQTEREVKTLYFGTAVAYYADASGTVAGHGAASASGWSWTGAEGDTAGRISRAIAIHESMQPPAFVSLPVSIR